MDLATSKIILDACERQELRDHAFGDAEIYWFKDGHEIAGGYFGGGRYEVWLSPQTSFTGDDALELLKCGRAGIVARNDETGPEDFVLDRVAPGLTREAVLAEITTPRSN